MRGSDLVGYKATTCIIDSCEAMATQQKFCLKHYKSMLAAKQRTSNGVNPGGGKKKLSDEQIAWAKKQLSHFKTKTAIAKELGVTRDTLSHYLKGAHSR